MMYVWLGFIGFCTSAVLHSGGISYNMWQFWTVYACMISCMATIILAEEDN